MKVAPDPHLGVESVLACSLLTIIMKHMKHVISNEQTFKKPAVKAALNLEKYYTQRRTILTIVYNIGI